MTTQLKFSDLDTMTPSEVAASLDEGKLDRILGVDETQIALIERTRNAAPLTADDITELARLGRHDLIATARSNGTIPMGPTTTTNR
jgi:hypothetical protein